MAIKYRELRKRISLAVIGSAVIVQSFGLAHAMPISRGLAVFTEAIEVAKAPKGWDAFCARYAGECQREERGLKDFAAKREDIKTDWSTGTPDNLEAIGWSYLKYWGYSAEALSFDADGANPLKLAAQTAFLNDATSIDVAFEKPEVGYVENKTPSAPRKIDLTSEAWNTLVSVNDWVNKNIKGVPDRKHFGVANKWVYPDDGKGDCKAYTLLKRRKLIEAGFPREALLITAVWTRQNQGHAVLTVRTDKGDYILDNLTSKVLLWSDTSLDFVKRQSVHDPNRWVYIDGYRQKTAAVSPAIDD